MRNLIRLLSLTLLSSCLINIGFAANKDFSCIMTDAYKDNKPGTVKNTFTPTTPEIFLLCDTTKVKKGDQLKGVWYVVSMGASKDLNQKITEKVLPVTQDIPPGLIYTSNMSLSKPAKGWPSGTYRVELYLNNNKVDSFDFSVK